MSATSQRIAELLHRSRAPSAWTVDDTIEISELIRGASTDEAKAALLSFVEGLLMTARAIVQAQRGAAITAAAMQERDDGGAPLQ